MAQKPFTDTKLVVRASVKGHIGKPVWVARKGPSLAASFVLCRQNKRSDKLLAKKIINLRNMNIKRIIKLSVISFGVFIVLIILIGVFAGKGENDGGSNSTPAKGTSEIMAYIQSKEYVKSVLKSPTSADFPFADYSYIDHGGDSYTIKSYVDSQNSFGAMIKSDYTITLKYLGGEDANIDNWELERPSKYRESFCYAARFLERLTS